MKYGKYLFLLVLVFVLCSAFSLKKKKEGKQVYAFGWAASFKDSVVYYTDIQLLDSVELDKNGFLPYRSDYSDQLQNYLSDANLQFNSVCMIYFSDKKSKLEKEKAKLQAKYQKDKSIILRGIDKEKFSFTNPEAGMIE